MLLVCNSPVAEVRLHAVHSCRRSCRARSANRVFLSVRALWSSQQCCLSQPYGMGRCIFGWVVPEVSNILLPLYSGLGINLRLILCEVEGSAIFETSGIPCPKARHNLQSQKSVTVSYLANGWTVSLWLKHYLSPGNDCRLMELEDDLEREWMWKKLRDKVTVVWRQQSSVLNMVDQKQFQNMEHINYFVSMITNDARHRRVIKSRLAMAKAAVYMKNSLFISKMKLN